MNKLEIILENYIDEEFLIADGFDGAVIGITNDITNGCERLIYSISKSIEILMNRDDMDYETALEFFNFNVSGAYMGPNTPIWMDDEMFD